MTLRITCSRFLEAFHGKIVHGTQRGINGKNKTTPPSMDVHMYTLCKPMPVCRKRKVL